MALDIPNIPSERLEQRHMFLKDRAYAHLEEAPNSMLSRACAATLLRDAGCIALLLEQPELARGHFGEAGHHFLSLGLPSGASLVALANVRGGWEELSDYEDVMIGVRQQWSPSEAQEHDRVRRPMADQARSEPRQLLAMMQAELLIAQTAPPTFEARFEGLMRETLFLSGGHPAGVTGLSIDSYVDIAEWFATRTDMNREMPGHIATSIALCTAARAEHFRTAMKDSYHWRMIARPSEVVDLDMTILMFLALGAGFEESSLVEMTSAQFPLASAPVKVAAMLRGAQDLEVY